MKLLSSNEGLVFQMERHFIMQVVCEATQCPDTRVSLCWGGLWRRVHVITRVCFQVRVAALQNLVKIMSLYYQYMETYMGPALFAVRPPPFLLSEPPMCEQKLCQH